MVVYPEAFCRKMAIAVDLKVNDNTYYKIIPWLLAQWKQYIENRRKDTPDLSLPGFYEQLVEHRLASRNSKLVVVASNVFLTNVSGFEGQLSMLIN